MWFVLAQTVSQIDPNPTSNTNKCLFCGMIVTALVSLIYAITRYFTDKAKSLEEKK
jgi:uncharacterized membrane-anchored protein